MYSHCSHGNVFGVGELSFFVFFDAEDAELEAVDDDEEEEEEEEEEEDDDDAGDPVVAAVVATGALRFLDVGAAFLFAGAE